MKGWIRKSRSLDFRNTRIMNSSFIDSARLDNLGSKVPEDCSVTSSIKKVYSQITEEILGFKWIMHFLRLMEDGADLKLYFEDANFREMLKSNISKIRNEDEKKTILWKIKTIKKYKTWSILAYLNSLETELIKL